jgi:DNA replication and repair protein RecF
LDEVIVPRVSTYIALFFSLLFNPDSLFRFRQFPAERRALFDRFLSFVDTAYLKALKDLRVVLLQKNKLLKSGRGGGLREWNQLFIDKGYAILKKRMSRVEQLNGLLTGLFRAVTGQHEDLVLLYEPTLAGEPEAWAQALERAEPRERLLGHALLGPHRDEFGFRLGGRDSERLSQGEYRGAFVALLLAMNGWLASERGYRPVLILDDLLSELDSAVQRSLLEHLSALPNQIFISTTHWTEGLCPAPAAVRTIEGGRIL